MFRFLDNLVSVRGTSVVWLTIHISYYAVF